MIKNMTNSEADIMFLLLISMVYDNWQTTRVVIFINNIKNMTNVKVEVFLKIDQSLAERS